MDEDRLIQDIARQLAASPIDVPQVKLGIGDDAAILASGSSDLVVTVDMLADGVDFIVGEIDPRLIGRKALAVNLSDIAAMAAEPIAAFPAVTLPRQGGAVLGREIFEGMKTLADEFGCAIAGGDTNSWDDRLVISVTLIGRVASGKPLVRSGAKPGDRILVTGRLGGSILSHQFTFTPRIREALLLNERYDLHAGMDISDGLLVDLSRMCKASSGSVGLTEEGDVDTPCGAEIELSRVPIADDAFRLTESLGKSGNIQHNTPLDHALADGEDFELLLAAPPEVARRIIEEQPLTDLLVTDIGQFIDAPGIWCVNESGCRQPIPIRGYQHRLA